MHIDRIRARLGSEDTVTSKSLLDNFKKGKRGDIICHNT